MSGSFSPDRKCPRENQMRAGLGGRQFCLQPAFSRPERHSTAAVSRTSRGFGPEARLFTQTRQGAVHLFRVMLLLLALAASAFAADQPQSDRGREVYQKWCTPCHGTGPEKAGTEAAAAHGIKPPVLEQPINLTPKMIESVRNGVSFMPRFRKTEISNADLAAISAYLVHR